MSLIFDTLGLKRTGFLCRTCLPDGPVDFLGNNRRLRAWNSAARITGRRWGDGGQRHPCVLLCPAGREWPLFGRGCRRRKNGRLPVSAEAGLKNQCGIWLHQDHLSGSMPGNQGTIPPKEGTAPLQGEKSGPLIKRASSALRWPARWTAVFRPRTGPAGRFPHSRGDA